MRCLSRRLVYCCEEIPCPRRQLQEKKAFLWGLRIISEAYSIIMARSTMTTQVALCYRSSSAFLHPDQEAARRERKTLDLTWNFETSKISASDRLPLRLPHLLQQNHNPKSFSSSSTPRSLSSQITERKRPFLFRPPQDLLSV